MILILFNRVDGKKRNKCSIFAEKYNYKAL